MQTLGEAKLYVADLLHEVSGDPATATLAANVDASLTTRLLPRWLEQGMERIFRRTWWRWTEDKISLTWGAAGDEGAVLYLPHFVYRIQSGFPASGDSVNPIRMIDAWRLDMRRPASLANWGFRPTLVMHGIYGVERDNPSDSTLTVTSTGGSGSQQVLLLGLDTDDYEIREIVTVASGASQASTNTFKAGVGGVHRVALVGTANSSIITVTNTGSGTQLERLDSTREVEHRHLRTELIQAGNNASTTYTIRYWRRPLAPTADDDPLPIPSEFHELLENFVESRFYQWRGEHQLMAMKMTEFNVGMREMIAYDRRDPAKSRRFGVARMNRRRWW